MDDLLHMSILAAFNGKINKKNIHTSTWSWGGRWIGGDWMELKGELNMICLTMKHYNDDASRVNRINNCEKCIQVGIS